MEQLTEQTGGAVYLPKTIPELDIAFDQIAADLSQQYVLSYYHRSRTRDGHLHVIDLKSNREMMCGCVREEAIMCRRV
jgi:hypothetical protein